MALPESQRFTIDDIYNLPEGVHAELIGGKISYMAPPTRTHQRVSLALLRRIADYIDKKGGQCEINPAPFAVFLDADDEKHYVEPDLSVICDPDKLDDKGCHGAPDWIIEIVSPSSQKMDYLIKAALYMNAGVREYWIVDPARGCTTIYRFEEGAAPVIIPFSLSVSAGIYDDLMIRISDLIKL